MTPAERLRKHQRALERTQRELDRERIKLENQEKKLVQDIKKSAKNGQIGACKIQAKDLVRTRKYVVMMDSTIDILVCLTYGLQIYPEILLDADAITGYFTQNSGTCNPDKCRAACELTIDVIDRPKQRTNDAVNERRYHAFG